MYAYEYETKKKPIHNLTMQYFHAWFCVSVWYLKKV